MDFNQNKDAAPREAGRGGKTGGNGGKGSSGAGLRVAMLVQGGGA